MDRNQLRALGWKPFFERQLAPAEQGTVVARVSAHYGSQLLLVGTEGEFRVPVQLVESVGEIAVGDWLVLTANDHRAIQRLERQTFLYRKASGEEVKPQTIAANVDTIFIVCSCNEDFSLSRIERYLALIVQSGATPVVVLTKSDLCPDLAPLRRQVEQLHSGLVVETLDARQADQAHVLTEWCGPGQTVALVGSSGVGKSTLANSLGAGQLATAEIRDKDGKGRHTTTSRSLHMLPSGGVLMDNPGIRELQLPPCEEGVLDVFDDVVRIAESCRFSDCRHEGDSGCAVQTAIESSELDPRRIANLQNLLAEQTHNSRTLAERHKRDQKAGRYFKSVLKEQQRIRDGH